MKEKEYNLTLSFLALACGVVLLLFADFSIMLAATLMITFAGIAGLMFGVMDLLKQKEIPGLIKCGVGLVALILAWTVSNIALYFACAAMILFGGYQIYSVAKVAKSDAKALIAQVIVPSLLVVTGILLCFRASAVYIVAGILVLAIGLLMFVGDKLIGVKTAKSEKTEKPKSTIADSDVIIEEPKQETFETYQED